MMLFYPNRAAARNSLKSHKLVDNGPDAPKGKRYARELVKPVKAPVREYIDTAWQDACETSMLELEAA